MTDPLSDSSTHKLIDRSAKVVALLAALVTLVTYLTDNLDAALISLAVVCSIGIGYSAWIVLARVPRRPGTIIGVPTGVPYVSRFDRKRRLAAAAVAAVQLLVILGIAASVLPRLPYFERIKPAAANESLVIVFHIRAPKDAPDITGTLVTTLKSELQSSPMARDAAMLTSWRIEQSRRAPSLPAATSVGKDLRSLFILLGSYDGHNVDLSLVLTEPSLLIEEEELAAIGLRLDGSPISLSIPRDEFSNHLIPLALFLKGTHFYLSGDFRRGEEHFTRVIDSSRQDMLSARAYFLRGLCRVRSGRPGPAEADYDEALQLGLETSAVHWRRAELFLLASMDFDAGEQALETAMELAGHSGHSYYVSGLLTLEQMLQIPYIFADMPKYFNKADDHLRVASEKDPLRQEPVLARARLHLRYGPVLERDTYNEVTAFLEDALVRMPESPELQLLLSRVKFEHGHADEATALLLRGVEGSERSGEFMIGLGRIHEASGDTNSALEYYTMFLDQPLDREGQWWERANTKVRIARLRGDSRASLFREVEASEASLRRDRFMNAVKNWIGRTWNRDFFGERSTEDFLLHTLTQSGVMPKTTDRQSARTVFRALLDSRNVEIRSGRLPLWCQREMGSGAFLVVDSPDEHGLIGIALDSRPNGKVFQFDIDADAAKLDFFHDCRSLRTDLEMAFNGD